MSSNSTILFRQPLKGLELLSYGEPPVPHAEHLAAVEQAGVQAHTQLRDQVLGKMEEEYAVALKELGDRLPDLVITMVRRLIGSLKLERSDVEAIIKEVLQDQAPEGETLEIELSPSDYDLLSQGDESFLKGYSHVALVKSERLSQGDCIAKSKYGIIDATLETKIEGIKEELS